MIFLQIYLNLNLLVFWKFLNHTQVPLWSPLSSFSSFMFTMVCYISVWLYPAHWLIFWLLFIIFSVGCRNTTEADIPLTDCLWPPGKYCCHLGDSTHLLSYSLYVPIPSLVELKEINKTKMKNNNLIMTTAH